ncbi:SEC26 [[Candida] subhashii]|uniref:Coatomer subunit beta n=1 Tax=[Candida] subhashii TaxID=561895 RepID=A0A8J5URS9_9ASCO|nr:SEC26 [[Candida] subhashii]KAG7665806.1 SEC26 [[Candida] subhashii]
MSMGGDTGYTLIYEPNAASKVSVNEFKTLLEKGKDEVKIDTMKKILITILNGDPMPDLLMHIIRFIMPSRNKELKKLLYFYWEVCPKMDETGKMRHEMILVCNAIQRDLQHPNEYIRGNTLRYLTKLKEPELLETLVPNVRQCLEHRHAYVRKNAVFALYSIYKVSDHLVPDADELIYRFLYDEADSVCKRNAFVCLTDLNRDAALQYIQDNISVIETLDPLLQLAFIDFIRRDALKSPSLNQQYAQLVTEIIESSSSNVVTYEAANTLTVLSSDPQSILLAGNKFVDLATKEANNNVKIITLDRIKDLNKQNPGVLQELSLEILRVLSTQDMDVRKKALSVILQFISSRNVEDVIKLLKKELQATSQTNEEKAAEYRQLLINAIHQMAIKFVEVAADVIDLLLDSIAELNTTAAYEVITFVKEVVEKFPDLRPDILRRLISALPHVRSGKVFRGALWIIGEYAWEEPVIQESWKFIRASVGEVPILASERKAESAAPEDEEESGHVKRKKGPVILPDGTYATESALTAEISTNEDDETKSPIRKQILGGDFYLGAVLSSTLVKLILRLQKLSTPARVLNGLKAEALLIMVSILRVGESSIVSKKIDEDSADRILTYIKILNDEEDASIIQSGFLEDTKDAFKAQIETAENKKAEALAKDFHENAEQVDDSIVFRQLDKDNRKSGAVEDDVVAVAGSADVKKDNLSSRLNKIIPLTGFSDPIYAEAFVKVHQYDVVLDVLLVNQTTNTLRNLSVEFATLGDLKVVDKPTTANIGPHGFYKVQTTIKVTSADTGVIFGNIVYDGQHSNESTIVILNDVHVDIMDYIKPATCSESQFRKMWNEFEWENKITIKSPIDSLKEYMDELMKGTNMNCLTPGAVIGEECQFLSANLYSRSTFGEDALANLCIEKQTDGPIIGHVRIRSKGQGLALSLGDRVASISRKNKIAQITHV